VGVRWHMRQQVDPRTGHLFMDMSVQGEVTGALLGGVWGDQNWHGVGVGRCERWRARTFSHACLTMGQVRFGMIDAQ